MMKCTSLDSNVWEFMRPVCPAARTLEALSPPSSSGHQPREAVEVQPGLAAGLLTALAPDHRLLTRVAAQHFPWEYLGKERP